MMEQINQQSAQNALAAKVAAASQYVVNDALRRGGLLSQAEGQRDKPLLEVEFDSCAQAVAALEATVKDLLERIAPICQPGAAGGGAAVGQDSAQIQAMPSALRRKVIGLRATIEKITRDIAQIKYRIEL